MKLIRNLSLGILFAATSLQVQSQTDSIKAFSLVEAQNYAIENFFASKNAKLDIKAAQKKIWETTAIGLPQVSVNGEYQRYLDDSLPSMQFPDFENWDMLADPEPPMMDIAIFTKENISFGGNVSQLIFSGEYIVGLQASKVYKLLSEENYEKVKIDLKESIAGTYFTILILNENIRVLSKTLENLNQNLDHSKKTLAVGLIEDTDVDQLQLTVKRTENNLTSVENQLKTMNLLLNYQMGLEPEVKVVLSENLENLLEQNIIDQSNLAFDLENHIDYKMLNTNEKLQQLSLKREKSLLLPNVSGYYNYTGVTEETAFTPPQHLVGLKVGWTIFQSGMRTAKISQARIEVEKAQNIKYQEAQRLILSAQQAQFDYETALTQYQNEEVNFKLSEKIFDKTTARYKEGFVSSLDLSIINTQYLQAQLSYALSIQNLLTTKVALDKAFSLL